MGHRPVTSPPYPAAAAGSTPAYGIKYLAQGAPARYTRAILEDAAKTIEAALAAGGVVPPGAADLVAEAATRAAADAAAANRLTALEGVTGPTEVAYAAGWAGYVDATATVLWSGLRYVRRAGVVTLSGAIKTTAATSANSLITTLPVGFRPLITMETHIPGQPVGTTVHLLADGRLTINAAQASTFVSAFPPLTYVAAP